MVYKITPVPKPRQTRRDKWAKRPPVMRYREFANQVRASGLTYLPGDHVIFYLPMPQSWPKKKRIEMTGKPHLQAPDTDNIFKALGDALYENDSHIWKISAEKRWAEDGSIKIVQKANRRK